MSAVPSDLTKAPSDVAPKLPERVVFFDGVCGFCDRTVQWLIERDPQRRLHFAPLQGPTAAELRHAHPARFPDDLDTLVVLDTTSGETRLLLRSDAVIAILDALQAWPSGLPWLRGVAIHIPRALRDLAYRLFAATRYQVWGRREACRIPTPEDRARFLD